MPTSRLCSEGTACSCSGARLHCIQRQRRRHCKERAEVRLRRPCQALPADARQHREVVWACSARCHARRSTQGLRAEGERQGLVEPWTPCHKARMQLMRTCLSAGQKACINQFFFSILKPNFLGSLARACDSRQCRRAHLPRPGRTAPPPRRPAPLQPPPLPPAARLAGACALRGHCPPQQTRPHPHHLERPHLCRPAARRPQSPARLCAEAGAALRQPQRAAAPPSQAAPGRPHSRRLQAVPRLTAVHMW